MHADELSPEDRHLLDLAALLANTMPLLRAVVEGRKVWHEQDKIDAQRLLARIEDELGVFPEPQARVAPADKFGGATYVERFFYSSDSKST